MAYALLVLALCCIAVQYITFVCSNKIVEELYSLLGVNYSESRFAAFSVNWCAKEGHGLIYKLVESIFELALGSGDALHAIIRVSFRAAVHTLVILFILCNAHSWLRSPQPTSWMAKLFQYFLAVGSLVLLTSNAAEDRFVIGLWSFFRFLAADVLFDLVDNKHQREETKTQNSILLQSGQQEEKTKKQNSKQEEKTKTQNSILLQSEQQEEKTKTQNSILSPGSILIGLCLVFFLIAKPLYTAVMIFITALFFSNRHPLSASIRRFIVRLFSAIAMWLLEAYVRRHGFWLALVVALGICAIFLFSSTYGSAPRSKALKKNAAIIGQRSFITSYLRISFCPISCGESFSA